MTTPRNVRGRFFVLVLAVLALAAAGCGGEDDATTGDTGAATATTDAATTAAETPETPTEPTAGAEETTTGPTTEAEDTGDGQAAPADCDGLSVGIAGPFTGDAASIGQEQLNGARFALERFNADNGTNFALVEADTQLDPAQATTVAQQFVSNGDILAVVGPAGSQEAEAVGPIFEPDNLAYIGMSATRTSLTGGDYPTFFRVVPNDDAQGPTDATYMVDELGAQNVFIIDDQTSYSTGLADIVQPLLEEAGVTVTRDSVPQDQTDFSALVSRISDDTDIVFLPWQLAASAQLFSQQMEEQGKTATIFGSDGLFSPDDFSAEGAYVSSFAPDITALPEQAELVEAYTEQYGEFGTFGPPTYAATQVALTAVLAACEAGDVSREAVLEQVGDVTITDSILGAPLTFDANGDVEGAQFYIFRIEGGEYVLVE